MSDWKSLAPWSGAWAEGDAADGLLHLLPRSPLTRDDCMYLIYYAPTSLEEENFFMEQGYTQGQAPASVKKSLPARRPSLALVAPSSSSSYVGLQEESLQSDNDYINDNRYHDFHPLESALSQELADNVAYNMDNYYTAANSLGTDEDDKAYLQQSTASGGPDHGVPASPGPQPPCVKLYPGELAQGLGLVRAECLALQQSYAYDSGRLMEAYLLMCGAKGVEPGNCSLTEALALPSAAAPLAPTTCVPLCSPQPSTDTPAAAAGPSSCPQPSTPLQPLCPTARSCCPLPTSPAAALARGSHSAPGTQTQTSSIPLPPAASSSGGGPALRIAPCSPLALASRSPACPASPFAAAASPSLPSPCCSFSPCGSAASTPSTPSTCLSSSPCSSFSSHHSSPFASPAGCTAAMDALLDDHSLCALGPASTAAPSSTTTSTTTTTTTTSSSGAFSGGSSTSGSSSCCVALYSDGCLSTSRRRLLFPSPTQHQGGLCRNKSWAAGWPTHSKAPVADHATVQEN